MKNANIKLTALLITLFLIDLFKPFGYSLSAEFTFLGIIFISLNCKLSVSLTLSIIFGYLKYALLARYSLLSLIEFPILCLGIHYILHYLIFVGKKKYALIVRTTIVFSAIVAHIIINNVSVGLILPLFSLKFLTQSFLLYFLLDYLISIERGWKFKLT